MKEILESLGKLCVCSIFVVALFAFAVSLSNIITKENLKRNIPIAVVALILMIVIIILSFKV